MSLTVSVVICTRNRPDDLAACLGSLGGQTRLPAEVVVVDASDTDEPRRRVDEWAAGRPGRGGPPLGIDSAAPGFRDTADAGARGLIGADRGSSAPRPPRVVSPITEVRYLAARPGLTRQRNLGVAAATGDVVTFLDDDVVLEPAYLARIVELFEADPELAGAEGAVVTEPLNGRRRAVNAMRSIFMMNTLGPRRGVKRSGFVTYDPWPTSVRRVSSLVGCNMSYRRQVFERFRFDEWFDGYGLCEDQDFSYRVGLSHKLVQTPAARLEHRLSPVGRQQLGRLHEMTAVNHYYFVRKNLPDTLLTWLAFLWSELGELLSVLKTGDRAAIAGKLRGYRRIVEMRRARTVRVPVQEVSS
ncbi:MAG TPA: glycosyltransferase family 2 protein [Candidatus Binatus sp.]|nr:glycosyltransferase family 2 protein [Candidatus Binatus sp.]